MYGFTNISAQNRFPYMQIYAKIYRLRIVNIEINFYFEQFII